MWTVVRLLGLERCESPMQKTMVPEDCRMFLATKKQEQDYLAFPDFYSWIY